MASAAIPAVPPPATWGMDGGIANNTPDRDELPPSPELIERLAQAARAFLAGGASSARRSAKACTATPARV